MGPRAATGVLLLVWLAGACGGGSGGTVGATPPDEGARLDVVDQRAMLATEPDAWVDAQGGEALDVGDGVRTDRDGFAQVVYHDGSLTRLGPRTNITVVALSDLAPTAVEVQLDVGETWHRVRDLAADGRFAVRTATATAAVRGTTFVVNCVLADVCRFTALEGELDIQAGDEVIRLAAGQEVTVTADGAGEVQEPGVAALEADPWSGRNLALDAGDDDPGAQPGEVTSRPVTVPAAGFDGTATFVARPEGGEDLTGTFLDVTVALDLDPADLQWIAWNDAPGLVEPDPGGSGELVTGRADNPLGVNDSLRVSITNPAGETRTVEIDVNDRGGVPVGPQAVLLGDAPTAPDVVRFGLGLPPRAIDEAGAFAADLFGEPGTYTFRFEALDSIGGGGGQPGIWLLVARG